ncbi:ddd75baf-485b-4532-bc57-e2813ee1cb89 [Thermothielavioides terrestris]|uniref:Ddd75baf-485b-4532-bc57-e2813ee1cb89 n=1 Tax=Thermothielavioides terrestris TaxID=2587410 RepID=A0A3S5CWN0_9PEZI|nr:ddd75baf-485b-4532-bc57-e2813ee1cb89 [Thermothielavioides terrestris]
MCYDTKDKG